MFSYCLNNPVLFLDPNGLCREVGALLTWVDCKSVFCPTSTAYRPHIAPKVDVTERLNKEMVEHEKELKAFSDSHNLIETGLYFKEKVQNGGDWDLKNQPDWCLSQYVTYTYDGVDYRHDAIGNIHYGYVGSAAFSDEILLMMAGYAQIAAHTSRWYYVTSWFDDPYDQMAIRVGCELWDSGVIK